MADYYYYFMGYYFIVDFNFDYFGAIIIIATITNITIRRHLRSLVNICITITINFNFNYYIYVIFYDRNFIVIIVAIIVAVIVIFVNPANITAVVLGIKIIEIIVERDLQ